MQCAMAAFVLATIAESNPKGQLVCHQSNLLAVCAMSLQNLLHDAPRPDATQCVHRTTESWDSATELFAKWLCLCLGNLWSQFPEIQVRTDARRLRQTRASRLERIFVGTRPGPLLQTRLAATVSVHLRSQALHVAAQGVRREDPGHVSPPSGRWCCRSASCSSLCFGGSRVQRRRECA
jgi:hypothetical protein